MFDLRIVIPAATAWLACGLGVAQPQTAAAFAIAAWVCAGAGATTMVILRLVRGRRTTQRTTGRLRRLRHVARVGWTGSILSLVGVALALTVLAADVPRRTPALLETAARSGDRVTLTVRADSVPQSISSGFGGADRWMWEGTATAASDDGAHRPLDTPVTVIGTLPVAEARTVALGASVEVTGALRRTEPGSSTSFVVMAGDGQQAVEPPPPWFAWTSPLREGLSRAAAHTPGDGGALLPGLSIGDVTGVGPGLAESMKTSALSHILLP
jgi:competence protein ComEC